MAGSSSCSFPPREVGVRIASRPRRSRPGRVERAACRDRITRLWVATARYSRQTVGLEPLSGRQCVASLMPQTRGFFDYVGAAFNARPFGMFVPPNWIGLGAFGLLGAGQSRLLGARRRPRARLPGGARDQRALPARRRRDGPPASSASGSRRSRRSSPASTSRSPPLPDARRALPGDSRSADATAARCRRAARRRARGSAACCGCTSGCWWRARRSSACRRGS